LSGKSSVVNKREGRCQLRRKSAHPWRSQGGYFSCPTTGCPCPSLSSFEEVDEVTNAWIQFRRGGLGCDGVDVVLTAWKQF